MSSQTLRNARKAYNNLSKLILDHYTSDLFTVYDIEYAKKRLFNLARVIKELEG